METFVEALKKNDIVTLEQQVSAVEDFDINQTDAEGKTAFLIAAQYADCATLKWLVQHGVDYKKTDYLERTALYYLIFESLDSYQVKLDKVTYLLSLGLDFELPSLALACSDKWQTLQTDDANTKALLDLRDEWDFTLLHYAAAWGNAALLTWLLQQMKVDIASKSISKSTALHCAVKCNQVLIVKQLLEAGANYNDQDNEGRSSLFLALQKGHWDIVELLWQQPALELHQVSEDGRTLLHVAAQQGYTEIIERLLTRQVKVNIVDVEGSTPLYYAACNGHLMVVKQLLACKADANLADIEDVTPLCRAAQNGHLAVVEALLEDPTVKVNVVCDEGTPLHVAAYEGHQAIVETLIEHQANVQAVDEIGATPLFYAAFKGHIAVVDVILRVSASNANTTVYVGSTPLHAAAFGNHQAIVSLLLAYQASVLTVDNNGQSALHYAAEEGNEACVNLLLAKAQFDLADYEQRTPLALAVKHGHIATVKLLLDTQLTQHPQKPLDAALLLLALEKGFVDVAQLLLLHIFDVPLDTEKGQRTLVLAATLGSLELVKRLLNINQQSYTFTADKSLALIEAAKVGHLAIVKLLLENGADINFCDTTQGKMSLYWACYYGHIEVVEYLLTQQANIADSFQTDTFLQVAVSSGLLALVKIALLYPHDVNAINRANNTALQIACENGYTEIAAYLMAQGAIINFHSEYSYPPIFLAARAGHTELVKLLVAKGFYFNQTGNDGGDFNPEKTALYIACKNGREEIACWLIEQGADRQFEVEGEATLLEVVAGKGLTKVVNMLLKRGINVNQTNRRHESPLYVAIKNSQITMARILLEAGADPNILPDLYKNSPLLLATDGGFFDLVKQLIQKRADVYHRGGYWRKTAFELACEKGYQRIAKYLLQIMPKVYMDDFVSKSTSLDLAVKSGIATLVEAVLKHDVNVNQWNEDSETPLQIAARNNDERIVNLLLQAGAEVDQKNPSNESSLLIATESDHLPVVRLLVEKGADINQQGGYEQKTALYIACEYGYEKLTHWLLAHQADTTKISENGEMVLHVAVKKGHKSIVKILLKYNVNVNQKNDSQETPLHHAIYNNHVTIARWLLAAGAEINAINTDNHSPLALAVKEGHTSLVKDLLDANADTTLTDAAGQTLLHIASEKDQLAIAKLLLGLIDLEQKDEEGFTPLHLAAREGHAAIAQLFINANAHINARTNEDETPLSLAIKHGHTATVKLLLEVMAKEILSQMTQANASFLLQALEDGNHKLANLLFPFVKNFEQRNAEGKNALCLAAGVGYVDIVKQLLEKYKIAGISPSEIGDFPLHEAAAQGHFSVVKLLIENGVAKDQLDDGNKRTALYLACEKGHKDIVKYLIYHKANMLVPFEDGKTLWHAVALQDDSRMVELLLPMNIPLNQADTEGNTPLHVAIQKSHQKVIEKLLAAKVQVNVFNNNQETPLVIATRRRDLAAISLLLSAGADCEWADQAGETPLFIAAKHNQVAIIEALVKANSIMHHTRQDGMTPLAIAIQENNLYAANLLLKLGAGIYTDIPKLPARIDTKNCVVIGATQAGIPITRATPGWQKAITSFEELTEVLHQQPVLIHRKALIKTCNRLINRGHPQVAAIQALRSHLYYTNNLFERCLLELHLPYHTPLEETYRELRRKFYQKEIFPPSILIEKIAEQEEDAELKCYSQKLNF